MIMCVLVMVVIAMMHEQMHQRASEQKQIGQDSQ
jgi:hypothetical protein